MKLTEQNPVLEVEILALADHELTLVGGGVTGESPIEPDPPGRPG